MNEVMWVYMLTDRNVWTVGYYDPEGKWHPDSDHPFPDRAAARVVELNGGKPATQASPAYSQPAQERVTTVVTPPVSPAEKLAHSPAWMMGRAVCEEDMKLAVSRGQAQLDVENPFKENSEQAAGWNFWYSKVRGDLDETHPRTFAGDGKYGTITAEKKEFHPGEPLFLIRSTDPLAADLVIEYADWAKNNNCTPAFVKSVQDTANRISAWQKANPTLVKKRPD